MADTIANLQTEIGKLNEHKASGVREGPVGWERRMGMLQIGNGTGFELGAEKIAYSVHIRRKVVNLVAKFANNIIEFGNFSCVDES